MVFRKRHEDAPEVSSELLSELKAIDLFADLAPDHLAHVAELVEIKSAKPGEEIVHEGTHTYEFFVVLSGTADATIRSKRRTIFGPGEFFGELAILGHTQTASVTADDQMRLGVIDAKEFKKLLDSEPSIAVHMVERLILRLEEMMSRPLGQLL